MAEEEGLPATLEELEERQEKELAELEEKAAAHVEAVKAAGKGKKAKAALAAAELEAEQWLYELRMRHSEETESLERRLSGEPAAEEEEEEVKQPAGPTAAELEAEREAKKKHLEEKALKKRQAKAAKASEREADLEREKREAGPSAREQELAALTSQLAALKRPLRVHEVAADGHCLYRAVGHQLRLLRPDAYEWRRPPEEVHEEVRSVCAAALRASEDDYAPFAELKDGEDFGGYCRRVESSGDWGGELELRALADSLRLQIRVHRAGEAKALELGKKGGGEPLQVTYHRHYYALGEHYNSTMPLQS